MVIIIIIIIIIIFYDEYMHQHTIVLSVLAPPLMVSPARMQCTGWYFYYYDPYAVRHSSPHAWSSYKHWLKSPTVLSVGAYWLHCAVAPANKFLYALICSLKSGIWEMCPFNR